MKEQYDICKESAFNRAQLGTAIPNRLAELEMILMTRINGPESWYWEMLHKILLSVARVCTDLYRTMDQEQFPVVAWNARNLLELWIWIKYCAASRHNARRFYEDVLRDMRGLTDALSKLHLVTGVANEFETTARKSIADVAREKLKIDSLDGSYSRVADAAKAIGLGDWFSASNTLLSKFAHPTAGLVVGIMHQKQNFRPLQAVLTTNGLYFAGQCVIALEEAISKAGADGG
jgi:hypothetical protein